jgi:hypothetical protein
MGQEMFFNLATLLRIKQSVNKSMQICFFYKTGGRRRQICGKPI